MDRIDHGMNIVEGESAAAELKRRGMGLTVCPISNRWCTDDIKAEQIRRLLEHGIPVT